MPAVTSFHRVHAVILMHTYLSEVRLYHFRWHWCRNLAVNR